MHGVGDGLMSCMNIYCIHQCLFVNITVTVGTCKTKSANKHKHNSEIVSHDTRFFMFYSGVLYL